jgi:hypothetical protein
MSTTSRNVFLSILGLIVGFVVLKWVVHTVIGILVGLIPLALVGGGIYFAYQYYGRKALTGGRRTLL